MFDLKFNHVAITIPIGSEVEGRAFYCDVLGFKEIEKPESLKKNGGFWLQTDNLPLHIGVEDHVDRRQTKRHPAFETSDIQKLKTYLYSRGIEIKDAIAIPGYQRFYAFDPFGNRIEFISPSEKS